MTTSAPAATRPKPSPLLPFLTGPLSVFTQALRARTLPVRAWVTSPPQHPTEPHWWNLLAEKIHPEGEELLLRKMLADATRAGRSVVIQCQGNFLHLWQGPKHQL